MSQSVSFVVLFYRDAPTVRSVISTLDEVLSQSCSEYEIIAIDDHSPDDTGNVIDQVASEFPQVRPLHNPVNLGVGGSFRQAVEATRFEWVGYTDGDDQYEVRDLCAFWSLLDSHDVISGHRTDRADGWHRLAISRHFNWLVRFIFGIPLHDTNAALKLYRGDMLRNLPAWSPEAFYDAEILIRLYHEARARFGEVPIRHRHRAYGQSGGISRRNITSVLRGLGHESWAGYRRAGFGPSVGALYAKLLGAVCTLITKARGAPLPPAPSTVQPPKPPAPNSAKRPAR